MELKPNWGIWPLVLLATFAEPSQLDNMYLITALEVTYKHTHTQYCSANQLRHRLIPAKIVFLLTVVLWSTHSFYNHYVCFTVVGFTNYNKSTMLMHLLSLWLSVRHYDYLSNKPGMCCSLYQIYIILCTEYRTLRVSCPLVKVACAVVISSI